MNPGRCRRLSLLATFAATTLTSCSSTPAASSSQSGGGSHPASSNTAPAASPGAQAAGQITVRTTTAPQHDCDWIPAAEVETIVGKLAGLPTEQDGCRYTLAMPDSVRALREKELRTFEAMGGTKDDAIKNYRYDPGTYAVTLSVDWNGGVGVGKLAIAKMFGADIEQAAPAGAASDTPSGWDEEKRLVHGFMGRTGHLGVTVDSDASDVPREPMVRLATAVRDRIPDVPFQVKNRYQVMMDVPANADPCGLLTRAEAEAVLGSLVVNPYRSSSYFPPLAHPDGNACAYFTAGHHVFVLSPEWSKGDRTFAMEKGIGGLVRQVMPQQETVIFKGPWDKSQVTMTGSLDFLKGDRKLEVNFLRSSTTRIGALKLATLAMQRLSAMTYEARTTSAEVRPAPGAGGTAPAWSRVLKLSDGRTMVADGAFVLDAALARPSALPKDEAPAGGIERFMTADLPNDFSLAQLTPGSRPRTYAGPDNVLFNADYVDYLRQTLPANRARIRVAAGRPAVVLLDGKPVGVLMPMK